MGECEPQEHRDLLTEVTQYAETLGYLVGDGPFHETQSEAVVERLQKVRTPTSLYVCGRADRFAVHTEVDYVFLWDAKTRPLRAGGQDIMLEALPFIRHLQERRKFDVRCLYVFRHLGADYEHGFWVEDHPPIEDAVIPPRWSEIGVNYFTSTIRSVLGIEARQGRRTSGSDDPYLVLTKPSAPQNWRELIPDFNGKSRQDTVNGSPAEIAYETTTSGIP